jgi:hypothetical protein
MDAPNPHQNHIPQICTKPPGHLDRNRSRWADNACALLPLLIDEVQDEAVSRRQIHGQWSFGKRSLTMRER